MVAPLARPYAWTVDGRQTIEPREVVIEKIVRETADAVTLVFRGGGAPPFYRAGQFLTIDPRQFPQLEGMLRYFEGTKGRREPPRAYSMSSAPHEARLAVTVKVEPFDPGRAPFPPILSPLLVHGLFPGQRLEVVGFTGPYTLPDDVESRTDHVVHVCAGSGIVPNFSILKDALHRGLNLRHTLLYGNKTYDDIIFRAELERLERAHPGRLRVIHSLSREDRAERHGPAYRQGRIGRHLLEAVLEDRRRALVFACGPGITPYERRAARAKGLEPAPRFLETVLGHLQELKVEKNRIHNESYG